MPRALPARAVEEVIPVTQVLDYRPPLADRPLTRLTTWLATPMSPRWRTATLVSSALVLWGAAWLPGAGIVEAAGWLGLALCATYGCVRKPMRWIVRRAYGLPPVSSPASEWYARWQLALLILAVSSPLFWWPLRLSMLVQRPLLNRFAWHAYAEAPMLDPPATPRLVALVVVSRVRPNPSGVELRVLGTTATLRFSADAPVDPHWAFDYAPWYSWWMIPPASAGWSVDSMSYRLYFR
jgi:hypothetical protein